MESSKVTVRELSELLYNFYDSYINELPNYVIQQYEKNGQPSVSIIIINHPIYASVNDFPQPLCTDNIYEAFTSNYRLIPPFYDYSSVNRANPNCWRSNLIVPRNVFLEDVLWHKILYRFYKFNLIKYPHTSELFKTKGEILDFLTFNIDFDSTDYGLSKFDVLCILQNVQLLLNVVYKNYRTPEEEKLEFELKRFKKLQKNYNSLVKNYKEMSKSIASNEKIQEDMQKMISSLQTITQKIDKILSHFEDDLK